MPVLLVLFVATVVELAVLIAVGHAIGVLATIGLLILTSLVGAALLRREGARTLRAFVDALRARRPPHRELLDGMLITAAGVLVVVPGFVSDVLGCSYCCRRSAHWFGDASYVQRHGALPHAMRQATSSRARSSTSLPRPAPQAASFADSGGPFLRRCP